MKRSIKIAVIVLGILLLAWLIRSYRRFIDMRKYDDCFRLEEEYRRECKYKCDVAHKTHDESLNKKEAACYQHCLDDAEAVKRQCLDDTR